MKAAHAALRAGTRAEHERLDALLGGFDLTDRGSYRAFLAAHAEGVFPVEAALAESAGLVVDDWDERSRGDALRSDLVALRVAPAEAGAAGWVNDAIAPDPAAPASAGATDWGAPEAAGALYVLEGSRLGAKFLVRMVGDGFPRAYLGAEQARGRWPALLDALDRVLVDDATTDRAVASARAVFARFETAARARLDANSCAGGENG